MAEKTLIRINVVKKGVSKSISQEVKRNPGKIINNKNDQGTDIQENKWPL